MRRYLKRVSWSLVLVLVIAQVAILFGMSLEENSPFIPFDYVSGGQAPMVGPQRGGIELRGVFDFGGEQRFSLYNPSTQKSVWVKLNDREAPYYVDSYDPLKQVITVTVNGVRQRLPISKSSEDVPSSGAIKSSINVTTPPSAPKTPNPPEPEEAEEVDEDDYGAMPEEEEEGMKRREMSEKVYEAFKKYVSEKRGQS